MFSEYSILIVLAEYRWLVAGLTLLILLIPYEILNDTRGGICRLHIRTLLWSYERRPGYSRLYVPGLLRLQRLLLRGLRESWGLVRERFLAGIVELLRRWLE